MLLSSVLVAAIAAAVDLRRCTRLRAAGNAPYITRARNGGSAGAADEALPWQLSRRALPRAVVAVSVAVAAPATASDLLDICPNCEQPVNALPLATIRGRWGLRASWTDDGLQRSLDGTVSFRSVGDPNRGRCTFASDDGQLMGSGSWVEKPARIRKGQFTRSARWRLKLSDGTVLTFRGDTATRVPDDFMEARKPPSIDDGEVLITEPVQRRVGAFVATQTASWQATEATEARISGDRDGRALLQ